MNLDKAKVELIETFLDKNKQFMKKLNCCYSDIYKNLNTFKFLPAHETIILSLPEIVRTIIADRDTKQAAKKNQCVQKLRCIEKNSCLKKKKTVQSDAEIKKNLLNVLKGVGLKLNFGTFSSILTDANVTDFKKIVEPCKCGQECNTVYKCIFICPVCPKKYILTYRKFWMSSIATKHIKKHIQQLQA